MSSYLFSLQSQNIQNEIINYHFKGFLATLKQDYVEQLEHQCPLQAKSGNYRRVAYGAAGPRTLKKKLLLIP